MTTIEEIFTEYPDSWLLCLPGYQQKTINELLLFGKLNAAVSIRLKRVFQST